MANYDFDSDPVAINERVRARDENFESSTQPMPQSQLRFVYYAVKDGRDGNTVCTSWEDVRAISAETNELSY